MRMPSPSPDPKANGAADRVQHRTGPTDSRDKSIIGNDLRIIGQGLKIISRGVLQIDGEIEGDVQAAEVIVGELGKVSGLVAGQQVQVNGRVSGAFAQKRSRYKPSLKWKATFTTWHCLSSEELCSRVAAAESRPRTT
jgi:Polymer-forming cytoskeletal